VTRGWFLAWLLIGPAIGTTLLVLPSEGRIALFTTAIFLDTGHSLSPIALAWTTRDFRRMMLADPVKYIALPVFVLAICTAIGFDRSFGHPTLFGAMTMVYFWWNLYHFGMQNFGILQLWNHTKRRCNLALGLGGVALGMGLPSFFSSSLLLVGLFGTGLFAFNHWLTDVALSSRISRFGWLFGAAMLVVGCVGFVWLFPVSDGMGHKLSLGPSLRIILGARFGLGFVHFLYSRWVWRRGSPVMAALYAQ
jgi:hypothetical protein